MVVTVDVFFRVVALGECEFLFRETQDFDGIPSEQEFREWLSFGSWCELALDLEASFPGVEFSYIEQEDYSCEIWERRR